MDVGDALLDILVVLAAAKLAAEIAERVHVPAVAAEITAGVLVGPSVLGLVGESDALRVLAQLGVILLLAEVGISTDLRGLAVVGRGAALVAVVGVLAPLAGGWAVASVLGETGDQALFLGAALTATSVGVTARVFADLRALASVEARTVLGAAVADDVLGLVILTIVAGTVTSGGVSIAELARVIGLAVVFLVVVGGLTLAGAPRLFDLVHRSSRSAGTLTASAMVFTLAVALLADAAELAPVVGAFVAGLALGRTDQAERVRRELAPIGHLLIPVFFLQIGIDARLEQLTDARTLGLAAALLAVAVGGKLVAAIGTFGSTSDPWLVGLGMVPRGEVGLIFAGLGLAEGVLGADLYGALVLVIVATTVVAPPLLRWRLGRLQAGARPSPATHVDGPWLEIGHGVVELAARPPDQLALRLGLEAAAAAASNRPGPELLAWLGSLPTAPLGWDDAARRRLVTVLRRGDARFWRFLQTTGLLERALPELADVLGRRQADPAEVDPSSVLRWGLVEQVRELGAPGLPTTDEYRRLEHPEWLLLAALILETADDAGSSVGLARRLAKRLDLGAAGENEVAMLVGEHGMLCAAALRPDAFDEHAVTALAGHIDSPERARALYLLTVAAENLELWQVERVTELHDLVQAALARPDLTGRGARNLVQRRRSEASVLLERDTPAVERLRTAPRAYLLGQEVHDVARQVELLDPVPSTGRCRVAVSAGPSGGTWRVEVVSRDRLGLLARITRVLASSGYALLEAVAATWSDGAALTVVLVSGVDAPAAAALESAISSALDRPLAVPPLPGVELAFDDHASPWYTICDAGSSTGAPLLSGLAGAFAAAGVDVHGAVIRSAGARLHGRFELSDTRAGKIDESAKSRLRLIVAQGAAATSSAKRHRLLRWRRSRGDRAETVTA